LTRVLIVGAGQLGSRHLQALQSVERPLQIHVVDPSAQALKVAEERFRAVAIHERHTLHLSNEIPRAEVTDIAIVATNADVRRKAAEAVLAGSTVRYMVLEKLLFERRQDYLEFEHVLAATQTRAWVNCPMRIMPPYERIRSQLGGASIDYRVSGGQFGLVTNAIHYIDHVAHLTGCPAFTLDTRGLDRAPVPSKRAGFLELNGRLIASFADGSSCQLTCYGSGNAPPLVEIASAGARWIIRESEGLLWQSTMASSWRWEEVDAKIPYQSQLTAQMVTDLLETGSCGLSPLAQSIGIHLSLLDPLLKMLQEAEPELIRYPFT
jgi:predicted dehydrogenase